MLKTFNEQILATIDADASEICIPKVWTQFDPLDLFFKSTTSLGQHGIGVLQLS
jgi:hypothetical protein